MKTIRCRRCNRKLLNRASRKLGIGPFCAVMEEKECFGTVQDWVDDVPEDQKEANRA